MRTVRQYREIPITYPVIEEWFDSYATYLESGREDTVQREKCVLLGLGVVNQFVQQALDQYAITIQQLVMEEIIGECSLALIEAIDTKEFDDRMNHMAFYSYFKKMITGIVYDFLENKGRQFLDISDINVVREIEEENTDAFNCEEEVFIGSHFDRCLNTLLWPYPADRRDALKYASEVYFAEAEPSRTVLMIHGVQRLEIEKILFCARFITRVATVSYVNSIELRVGMQKIDDKNLKADKLFLTLLLLDDYTGLPEVYSILGDKIFSLIRVLDGETLKLPTYSMLKRSETDVSAYIEIGDDRSDEHKQAVADHYKIGLQDVNEIIEKFDDKLKSIIA